MACVLSGACCPKVRVSPNYLPPDFPVVLFPWISGSCILLEIRVLIKSGVSRVGMEEVTSTTHFKSYLIVSLKGLVLCVLHKGLVHIGEGYL